MLAQLVFDVQEVALVAVDTGEFVDDDDVDLVVADIAHHPLLLEGRHYGRFRARSSSTRL